MKKEKHSEKENKSGMRSVVMEESMEKKSELNCQRERLGSIQDRLMNLKRNFI